MQFKHPPGFTSVPVRSNQTWAYDHAIRSASGNLELRYRIDSFLRLAAQRKQAMEGISVLASVNTNDLYLTNGMAVVANLAGNVERPLNPFPPDAVRTEFA